MLLGFLHATLMVGEYILILATHQCVDPVYPTEKLWKIANFVEEKM